MSIARQARAQTVTCVGNVGTLTGSIDTTDSSQNNRFARNGADQFCPAAGLLTTPKTVPNLIDPNPRFYDVYHFVNTTGAAACFTFAVNWNTAQNQLFAAAYSAFDPTNIQANYLGDINRAPGNTLTPPQANPPFSMGLNIGAGNGVDVVVNAVNATFNTSGSESYTVTFDCSSLTVTSSAIGLSWSPSGGSSAFGQSVTFTVHSVGNMGGPVPTGTITIKDGSTVLTPTPLTIDGSGNVTFTTSTLGVGGHSLSAVYSGDATYPARTSYNLQTVNKANSATATVTSSANPQVFGGPLTLSTTVTAVAPGAGTPTGTVTFLDGATSIGTATLTGGAASLTLATPLAVGSHSITASYGGSGNFNTSTSAAALTQTINMANTATALASSTNPQDPGASVTFTATVTAVAPGAGTPSGTVTFSDGATTLGTGTLAAGVATFSTSSLVTGSHSITATYGGDASFNGSTSAALTQFIRDTTTTVVTSSANPQFVGELVTFTATVTGTTGVPMDGTVAFFDGTTALGGPVLVVGGQAAFTTGNLAIGAHSITAVFSGDPAFTTSTSAPLIQTITTAPATVVVTSAPAGSASAGDSVVFTATVSATFGGAPTGSVTFQDGGTPLGTVPLTSGTASFSTSTLAVGPHTITALYSGDTNHDPASGSTTLTVNPAATTTVLTSSVNPTVFGQATVLTATVTSAHATPTGTVSFQEGATTLGTGTLDGAGHATLSLSSLSVGTHTLTAVYGGNASFNGSTSAAVMQTVSKSDSTAAVTVSSIGIVLGTQVTFTATVGAAPPGSGTPTGMVTFSDGATTLGTATLAGGQAQLSTSALAVGVHNVSVSYTGDGNFNASASTAVTVTVGANASSTTLVSSANPQTVGGAVTFTATVTGNGSPTGTVTFLDGTTTLGTATLATGQASFTTSALAPGMHAITASYGGDADFVPSVSAVLNEQINQAASTVALAALPNPATAGQSVTFTATVTSTGGGTPGGTVTFSEGGTTLGTGNLASGVATVSTSTLAVGSHTITASYPGDTNHTAATGTVTEVILSVTTTTTLASSSTSTVVGQPTTLTATVAVSGATPTGSVIFLDGTSLLGAGAVAVNSSGVASLSVRFGTAGTHSLTAQFTGTGRFANSTSTAVVQNVGQAGTSVTLTTSSSNVIPGASVTFVAAVSVSAPGSATPTAPTGNVTISDGTTLLTTVALSGGFVSFSTTTLALGTHSLTATYVGDANFTTSTSPALVETVSQSAVTAALVANPTSTTYGQDVTFTATMTAAMGGTPTGTVTFTDGTATLGMGTLDANGSASLTTRTLSAGTHMVQVSYGGDTVHAGGSTASATLTVAKRATSVFAVADPSPATVGAAVTITATLTVSTTPALGASTGALAAASGSVTFKDGTTTIGTGTLAADGTATFMTDMLTAGSHMLLAEYEGDTDYATSTSQTVTLAVSAPATDGGVGDGGSGDGGPADAAGDAKEAGVDAAKDAGTDAAKDTGAAQDASSDAAKDATASVDAGTDAPKTGGGGGGCGCELGGGTSGRTALGFGALALALALGRRRRR
jgi:MYXO-CTERM domain-containing protein